MSKLTYGDNTIETSVDLGSDVVLTDNFVNNYRVIVRYKDKFPHIYAKGMYKLGNGLLPYYEVERLFALAKDVQTFSVKNTKSGKVVSPYKQVKGHLANEIIERLEVFLDEMQDEEEVYTLSTDIEDFAKAVPTNLSIRQMYTEPQEVFYLTANLESDKFDSFPKDILETAVEIYLEAEEVGEHGVRLALSDAIFEHFPEAKLTVHQMDKFVTKSMEAYNNPGMFESSLLMFKAKDDQEQAFKTEPEPELEVEAEEDKHTKLTDEEVIEILEESNEMARAEEPYMEVAKYAAPDQYIDYDNILSNPDAENVDTRLIKILHAMFNAVANAEGLDVLLMHPKLIPTTMDYEAFMNVPVSRRLVYLDNELYSDLVSEFPEVAENVEASMSVVKLYGIAHAIYQEGDDIRTALFEALEYAA